MDVRLNVAPLPFPPPEFDDFIEGENNQLLAAGRELANGGGLASSLYVWGGDGCGKTHFLRMLVSQARLNGNVFFISDEAIPSPMPALLVVDDIHDLSANNRLLLFDWQNKIKPDKKYRIVASGNVPPKNLPLGAEINARLAAGLVFCLREIPEKQKRQALMNYAKRRGFDLPEAVINIFLTRLPRDMSSLTAALASLDNFLLAQQKPLTLPLVRLWLRQSIPSLF